MATKPTCGPSKIFSGTDGLISTKLVFSIGDLKPIIVCSNDDPGLNLTYFTARSNFAIGKSENGGFLAHLSQRLVVSL